MLYDLLVEKPKKKEGGCHAKFAIPHFLRILKCSHIAALQNNLLCLPSCIHTFPGTKRHYKVCFYIFKYVDPENFSGFVMLLCIKKCDLPGTMRERVNKKMISLGSNACLRSKTCPPRYPGTHPPPGGV